MVFTFVLKITNSAALYGVGKGMDGPGAWTVIQDIQTPQAIMRLYPAPRICYKGVHEPRVPASQR